MGNSMNINPLTHEQRELLELLSGELQSQLDFSLSNSSPSDSARLAELADLTASFVKVTETIGLQGLAEALHCLQCNFQTLAASENEISNAQTLLIDSWVIYFLDYLQQLAEQQLTATAITGVIDFLTDSEWPLPLAKELQPALFEKLSTTDILVVEDTARRLPLKVDASYLSLHLNADINPELFEGLMLEMPLQVSHFAEQIEHFNATQNKIALASAQRIAHTLKGSANVVGISGLANFMHYSEDLLEEISRHLQENFAKSLQLLLVDIADTLASMLDNLSSGEPVGQFELTVMQRVLDAYHSICEHGLPHEDEEAPVANALANKPDLAVAVERVAMPAAVEVAATDLSFIQPQTSSLQEAIATQLRVKETTAQDLLRLAGESAIATNRLQTQVQDVKQQMTHIGQLHHKLTTLTEEFGYLIEVRELFNSGARNANDDGLDPLELDRYNELHSFFHQLQEFAIDTRDAITQTQSQLRQLEDLTFEQQVTNRESQLHLLEMRMVPANTMESRFQRCVRQACRLTEKNANLVLVGGDTLIDSRVLHELIDPLMHLLRNAVDHGIETSAERIAQGKLAEGIIELRFRAQGQFIVIQVVDDGSGLQQTRIANKARELSLTAPVDANADVIDIWLKQLIFTAGFSTRDQVSQTSGRGIGLDVVADRVSELKGRISVESEQGLGCTFSIRLPMTMITEHGLLITSGTHRLAISARGVEQLLYLNSSDLTYAGQQIRYSFNHKTIDVFHVAQIAQLPDAVNLNAVNAHALLIVESLPGHSVGVLVDRVVSSREMVIKPLTPFTPSVPGVIGATILGDGEVAPVVDIQQLVLNMLQLGNNHNQWMQDALRLRPQATEARPMALVVDDSLSTRRSLAQFVNDMGMDVRTAKDGFEAIDILQEQTPSIILVDMEMPRMNGLEFTAHVRANDITKHIPVIMITSRNTDKHRNLARAAGVDMYVNKPFSEEELLQFIQDAMHSSDSMMSSSPMHLEKINSPELMSSLEPIKSNQDALLL
jgi:chemotaxis protein histidine kinase CheA/DNA-binding NarL/FixJ family response regulator